MKIEHNILLSPLTTFGIGGKARYFCRAQSGDDLIKAAQFAKENHLTLLVLGGGSNVLFPNEGFEGLVVKIEMLGIEFTESGEHVEAIASAGEDWDAFVELCVQKGLYGIENLSGIPGTVGASPVQNIGAYGAEVKDTIKWVEVFDIKKMKPRILSHRVCKFGYRDSVFKHNGADLIVLRVAFALSKKGEVNISYRDVREYVEKRKISNPGLREVREAVLEIRSRKFPDLDLVGTAGSFFKNPIVTAAKYERLRKKYPELPGFPAGNNRVKLSLAWIIDHICKLKDLRIGDAGVSPNQTLVLCNFGNAGADDIRALAREISSSVKQHTGIEIEPEVKIM